MCKAVCAVIMLKQSDHLAAIRAPDAPSKRQMDFCDDGVNLIGALAFDFPG
jgi:hypothetical protein